MCDNVAPDRSNQKDGNDKRLIYLNKALKRKEQNY
jgi:hypothetical protein